MNKLKDFTDQNAIDLFYRYVGLINMYVPDRGPMAEITAQLAQHGYEVFVHPSSNWMDVSLQCVESKRYLATERLHHGMRKQGSATYSLKFTGETTFYQNVTVPFDVSLSTVVQTEYSDYLFYEVLQPRQLTWMR